MEARAAEIAAQRAPELVWLLEHPRSTPPAPAAGPPTCSIPLSAVLPPGAAARSPTTAPASGWPM